MMDDNDISLLRCTCAFIKLLCNKLDMNLPSQCTALVFFQRFFKLQALNGGMKRAIREHDRFAIGCAAVFLAGKVEEDNRKLDAIVKEAESIRSFRTGKLQPPNTVITGGGLSSSVTNPPGPQQTGTMSATPPPNANVVRADKELIQMIREKILLCERVLLHTLEFDVSVTHPHLHALGLLKRIRIPGAGAGKGLSEFRQIAWNFLNDSLFSDVCVKYDPEPLGAASVLLAYYMLKARIEAGKTVHPVTKSAIDELDRTLRSNPPLIFDQPRTRLESIIQHLLYVYESPKPFLT